MHLIKLKIKNIASLKGEHLIDFESIQKESSLFAITGETGSGKSTILNSISLSLYGQVYKKNLGQLDLVTLGEKEGSIDLIFQVKNKYYLATWRAKVLKQNGEPYSTPQTPTRELYELASAHFESSKHITLTKTEELLHLDFDQFCKCVILNQGEFARFISSSFSERKEILEKLYPGEVLEGLGRELKSDLEIKLKEQNNLEIEMSALGNVDFNESDLLLETKELKNYLMSVEYELNQYEKIDLSFNEFRSNLDKSQENKIKLLGVKKELSSLTTTSNKIVLDHEASLNNYEIIKAKQTKELPHLQLLLKKEENLKSLKESVNTKLTQLTKGKTQIQALESELMLERARAKIEFEKSLELSKEFQFSIPGMKFVRSSLQDYFDLDTQKATMLSDLALRQNHLHLAEKSGLELKTSLEKIVQKLNTLAADLSEKLNSLLVQKKATNQLLEKRQLSLLKRDGIKEILSQLEADEISLKKERNTSEILLKSLEKEISDIKRELKMNELINSIELCFTHPSIKTEGTCPVCQTHHNQDKWQELETLIKKTSSKDLETQWQLLEGEKALISSKLTSIKETLAKNENHKKTKKKEVEDLHKHLLDPIPDIDSLDKEISLIQRDIWEKQELSLKQEQLSAELKKARESYQFQSREIGIKKDALSLIEHKLLPMTESIQNKLNIKLNETHQADLKLDFKRLENLLQIENDLLKIEQSINYLDTNLKKSLSDQEQENKELQQIEEKYQSIYNELTFELKGSSATELINKLNNDTQKALETYQFQDLQMKKIELQLKEFQAKVYNLEDLIKDFDLQSQKSFHAAQLASKELLDFGITPESQIWPKKLLTLAHGDDLPKEVIIGILDDFRDKKVYLKLETQATQLKLGHLSAQLENHLKLKLKIEELKKKHQQNELKLNRLKNLYEVLGKDELRTFVLSLVEENLISYTNIELQKLCLGRYELIHQSKKMGLTPDFYILDKFKNAGIRKITTLSGGETFMVSLAMALALGEMTRGQAELDTLFIDEGFGTLDQDSLEDVLDMLKQIQSRGPMIGLISHIKTLTEALTVNLTLFKRADGTSKVTLTYN